MGFFSAVLSFAFLAATAMPIFGAGPNKAVPPVVITKYELFHLKTSKVLYVGESKQTEKDGVVRSESVYKDTAGKVVEMGTSVWERAGLKLISYRKENPVSGELAEMDLRDGTVTMTYREKRGEKGDTGTEKWESSTAFSSVVSQWMYRDWAKLEAGGDVTMDYLVISRQETIGFRLKKHEDSTLAGEPVMVVRMEPDSFVIRALVDPLYFYVTKNAPHRLLQYAGRSSIKTDDGKDQDLRVVYHHGTP